MSILKVARLGHPVLRDVAKPVTVEQISSSGVQRLIQDMVETMREYGGVGLAAPQVNESSQNMANEALPRSDNPE
jgi:peptide deformylase